VVCVCVCVCLAGCTDDCSGHGTCQLFSDTWLCRCRDGWKGVNCDVAMEMDCDSGRDEDNGQFVDLV